MARSIARCSRTTPERRSRKKGMSEALKVMPSIFPPDPVRLELGGDLDDTLAGYFHLVDRLDGGEAGGAALAGSVVARIAFTRIALGHVQNPVTRLRLMRRTASAASAAPPPLFISSTRARARAWASILDREDTIPKRKAARHGEIHQRSRTFAGDDLVMPRLAPDHAGPMPLPHHRACRPPRPGRAGSPWWREFPAHRPR